MTATVCAFGWLVFVFCLVATWIISAISGSPRERGDGAALFASMMETTGTVGAVIGVLSGAWWIALRVTR